MEALSQNGDLVRVQGRRGTHVTPVELHIRQSCRVLNHPCAAAIVYLVIDKAFLLRSGSINRSGVFFFPHSCSVSYRAKC